MLIFFILVSILPLIILGLTTTLITSRITSSQSEQIITNLLEQVSMNFEYQLNEIMTISDLLYQNKVLRRILRNANAGYSSIEDELNDYLELYPLISQFQNNDSVYRIRVYLEGNSLLTRERNMFFSTNEIKRSELYQEIVSNPLVWVPTRKVSYLFENVKSVFTLYKTLRADKDFSTIIGFFAIDVLENKVNDELARTLPYNDCASFLMTDRGFISYIYTDQFKKDIFRKIDEKRLNNDISKNGYKIPKSGSEYIFLSKNIDLASTPWKLGFFISKLEVNKVNRIIVWSIMLSIVITSLVAILITINFSRNITFGLNQLEKSLEGIHRGKYIQIKNVTGNDEIAQLQLRYNELLKKIEELIENDYKIQIALKSEELKALEGQINPHFLYNTLDTARWMALRQGSNELATMIDTFSRFFRISLNRGKEISTIGKEIEHIEAYIELQNIRFNNGISLKNTISKKYFDYPIPRLVLQPLVENSIIHGFSYRSFKTGEIMLSLTCTDNQIVFTISDDGIGFKEDDYYTILETKASGYGLYNINQRLKLYFGESYGLSIGEKSDRGAVIDILLPKNVNRI